MSDFFTVNELAKRVRVSPKVIDRLAREMNLLKQDETGREVIAFQRFFKGLPGNTLDEIKLRYRDREEESRKTMQKMNILSLRSAFHSKVTRALKRNLTAPDCEAILGYSMAQLKNRLKKTISEGFTWQDFIEGRLHLDHIIPGCAFNIEDTGSFDFWRAWRLDNLQLLPVPDHRKKGRKFSLPFQPGLALGAR